MQTFREAGKEAQQLQQSPELPQSCNPLILLSTHLKLMMKRCMIHDASDMRQKPRRRHRHV